MSPLNQLEKLSAHLTFLGAAPVPADRVLAALEPVIRAMAQDRDSGLNSQFLSLSKAKLRSGKSDSYFRAPLRCFGGRSRLEIWEVEQQAHQEGRQWFIAAAVIPMRSGEDLARSRRHKNKEALVDSGTGNPDSDKLYQSLHRFMRAVP